MNLPDFLCIGAQKAGTSWLYKVLQEHPQIYMPPINELHFFDRIGTEDRSMRYRHHQLAHKMIAKEKANGDDADADRIRYLERIVSHDTVSVDWYRETFSWPVADGVRKGDITPSYLELSDPEVAYARELLGPAKLILIIRRPLDRQLSQLRMWAYRQEGDRVPQNEGEWMRLYRQMSKRERRGAYSEGIARWQSHFGQQNLLVLPFGMLKFDPRGMLDKIEDFLGIERLADYRYMTSKVHVTQKLDIPESVVARAAGKIAAENEYLITTFGEAFFEQTR